MSSADPLAGMRRFISQDVERRAALSDDEAVVRLIEDSMTGRLIGGAVGHIGTMWRQSRASRVAFGVRDQVMSLPLWQRVRALALTLLTAIVVHVWLTGFSAPEPTTLARTVWVGVSIVLAAAMVGAHQVAAAWVDWSRRGAAAHESERE
jgi:hypothetical protein